MKKKKVMNKNKNTSRNNASKAVTAPKQEQAQETMGVVIPQKNGSSIADIRIQELDMYLFGQATHYDIFEKLGAHEAVIDGKKGVYFAVWAPTAKQVNVIGTFNDWNEESHPMTKQGEVGIYDVFVEGAAVGDIYKYLILSQNDEKLYKADPYANYSELRPKTASVVASLEYEWNDKKWMTRRDKMDIKSIPTSIYEVHPGSWKKHIYRDDSFFVQLCLRLFTNNRSGGRCQQAREKMQLFLMLC